MRLVRLGLMCVSVVAMSCAGSSTAEDARRAELLDTDPLFTTELDGVRWETSAVAGPGSGPGPGTYWTDAFRWGSFEGDPEDVLLEAAKTADRFGWTVTDAHCFSDGNLVDGWKQFDRFVALLSISLDETTHQFFLKAQTPPINAGGPTNTPPLMGAERTLSRTCLVKDRREGEVP